VLHDVLKEFGIYATIGLHSNAKNYIAKDEKVRNNAACFKLNIYAGQFKKIGFLTTTKQELVDKQEIKDIYRRSDYATIQSIESVGMQDVYDITVNSVEHAYIDQGVTTHNCGEIVLRDTEFCNLTSVIVRPEDDLDTLLEKVECATWIGTLQASFTKFPYLRPQWEENCKQEALLGVSISGQMDNPELLTAEALKALKSRAIKVNKRAAKVLGINEAAAITCVKPEGTSSQVTNSGSGLHPWFSQYFIRRYRISAHDPLCKMLQAQGVVMTPENGQTKENANTWVISFPAKAPEGAVLKDNVSAIQQLEHYKKIQTNWCEHNASITVYVKDSEWFEVGNWVYENWDIVNGISFLPYDGGRYEQAPYEEITKERYERLLAEFPKIDYSQLSQFELEDGTEGAKTYACVGNACEIN
jgi:hypothetical protein